MVNVGLQLRLEAKPGKEKELEEFLRAQLPYALGEPATVAWFATVSYTHLTLPTSDLV